MIHIIIYEFPRARQYMCGIGPLNTLQGISIAKNMRYLNKANNNHTHSIVTVILAAKTQADLLELIHETSPVVSWAFNVINVPLPQVQTSQRNKENQISFLVEFTLDPGITELTHSLQLYVYMCAVLF